MTSRSSSSSLKWIQSISLSFANLQIVRRAYCDMSVSENLRLTYLTSNHHHPPRTLVFLTTTRCALSFFSLSPPFVCLSISSTPWALPVAMTSWISRWTSHPRLLLPRTQLSSQLIPMQAPSQEWRTYRDLRVRFFSLNFSSRDSYMFIDFASVRLVQLC
jgi:hypothetical protein